MTCDFALEDGAYVLGALSPTERAGFERHLSTCAACRDGMAALAVLPGLLGRLDGPDLPSLAVRSDAERTASLDRLLAAASRQRRGERRRMRMALAAGVVAFLLAVGTGVTAYMHATPTPVAQTQISQSAMIPAAADLPVTASLGIAAATGGTRIDMTCHYVEGRSGQWLLRLMVYPADSTQEPEQVSTWLARSGDDIPVSAFTHFTPSQIGHIELQSATHVTLLSWPA